MTLFVGRQPILNKFQNTYGYELLFRDSPENFFNDSTDPDQASMSVIDTSIGQMGMQHITGGKKAFINFTRRLLLEDYGTLLPRDNVVIEILETIEPDEEIVAACQRLKDSGYTLALDDFQYSAKYDPLVELIDIIKVDLMASDLKARQEYADLFLPMKIKLLAERVETLAEFEETRDMGYSYFQGYFFSKPVVLSKEQTPESKLAKMQLLMEISKPEFDFKQAEEVIKHDPTLSMKLLRYINSVIFGIRQEITSIRQALTLLGEKNIRKWATILVISGLSDDKPDELLRQAIVRARFCELLAQPARLVGCDQELFMTGMFSLMDTMMDQTMESLLTDLALSQKITDTLLGEQTPYQDILSLVRAYEKGEWDDISQLADTCCVEEDTLPPLMQEAFKWADIISLAG